MDKRSFLAVVMTFAILIGWQVFYVGPQQRKAAEREAYGAPESLPGAEDDAAVEPADVRPEDVPERTHASEDARPSAGQPAAPPADDEPAPVAISVENGVMRAGLSSRGGEFTSIELVGFPRYGGGDVRMVPEGAAGAVAVELEAGGRWTDLSGRGFRATVRGRPVRDGERIVLGAGESVEIAFAYEFPGGGLVEKSYLFSEGSHEIGLAVRIRREGELLGTGAYAASWRCGLPVNEKDAKADAQQFTALGRVGEEFFSQQQHKFSKTDRITEDGVVVWAGAKSKYFLCALLTQTQRSGRLALLGGRQPGEIGWAVEYPFRGDPRLVEDSYRLYVGPLDMAALKAYEAGLEKAIDLGRLRFFSSFILGLMVWMKRFIPNYGVVIVIISIMTKVLFYRLTHKSFKSMKDMQRLQPKIKELQEKHKDDRTRLNQETMKLYKQSGVNPLGGCLPLLLQMPVFIALFNVLRNTIELRGAPFVLWIDDLSSPDVLFSFGARLPFLGSDFHMLPILMGAAMWLQSKMGGSPTGEATGPAAQTKMMQTMMPVVFTVLFYGMPSGLVLYWLVNNIFSIIQQYAAHRQIEAEEAAVAAAQ